MRIAGPGSVIVLSLVLAACSSSAGGSPGPANGASSGAPAASAAVAAPASQAAGAGAGASQAAGGGGTSTGLAAKPCSLLTEAEVAGILHGAMVATPGLVTAVTGVCEYISQATGNRVIVNIAEGAASKAAFDGYSAAGQLGSKVDGIGDAAFYGDGEISIWKGDHGVGITIEQSDATDEASLKALAVALGGIAAGRL